MIIQYIGGILLSLLLNYKNNLLEPFFPVQNYPTQDKQIQKITENWEKDLIYVIDKTRITNGGSKKTRKNIKNKNKNNKKTKRNKKRFTIFSQSMYTNIYKIQLFLLKHVDIITIYYERCSCTFMICNTVYVVIM